MKNCKKAPGEDGISRGILPRAYKHFLNLINTLYNECLRQGCFLNRWTRLNVKQVTTPGKKSTTDPSKFIPLNILNVGRNVLEKLLLNTMMHHVSVHKQSPES